MKHDIPTPQAGNGLARILRVMKQLRDPEDGCPWDVKQSFATIAPYTVEEAYEVADAIERDDWVDLKEELGDLLLQVVFHAQMAQEAGLFDFDDVAHGIADKMVHRHPHVFKDMDYPDEAAQKADWDRIKTEEKRAKQAAKAAAGLTTRAALRWILSVASRAGKMLGISCSVARGSTSGVVSPAAALAACLARFSSVLIWSQSAFCAASSG